MLDFQYMDSNFDITSIPCFDNLNGLKDISSYMDFGIKKTIHKQIPNITLEMEIYYAKIILKQYMNGDSNSFTSQYNIRNNIGKIGRAKIISLLLKTLIEKSEYSKRVLHRLNPQDFGEECAYYVTDIAYYGQLDNESNQNWIQSNIESFIDIYVDECYGLTPEGKMQREEMCYGNTLTTKALEQLNLEMKLSQYRK